MPSSLSPPSTVVAVDPYPPCSIFLLAFLCFRSSRNRTTPSSSDSPSKPPPHRFSYSLLRHATASFSTLIGHGGFGPVFSGSLPSTRKPIAVKLMDSTSLQGEREFHNELLFASKLHYSPHVVVPTGFAAVKARRRFLLVYELMPNGNLQDALLRRKSPELRNWKKRFAIIIDIARGIRYLHHSCDPPVIHGDIKPSNILLDASFSAKIGDYGLARLKSESQFDVESETFSNSGVEETESISISINTEPSPETEEEEANLGKPKKFDWWFEGRSRSVNESSSTKYGINSTPSMRGTVCYVAPEYNYEITEKCDVYGFGVLILVMVSGRRPLEAAAAASGGSPLSELQRGNLLSWARHCARNGKLLEIVDESLKSLDTEEALLCMKVALLCLLKSPSRRPSMEEVVGMLCGEVEPPPLPAEYSPSPPPPRSRFPFKCERNER
ncbi:receptor-like serine/threonine-protein kinase [Senna tora]|uniref:non-specific serine/threonine protein kinase n=1 Tax=Senna tora TaxID=362788 RepID=A0A834TAM2_9FABA|nr:receptor-like serine/threonine-protein kinase [Senna tora]